MPFPDFGGGSYQATYGASTYHGLQTKLEEQFSNGLTFLLTYTWSKAMSDAGDLLNGGSTGRVCALYRFPASAPGSIGLGRTSTFATSSTSAADMSCPSAKTSGT